MALLNFLKVKGIKIRLELETKISKEFKRLPVSSLVFALHLILGLDLCFRSNTNSFKIKQKFHQSFLYLRLSNAFIFLKDIKDKLL